MRRRTVLTAVLALTAAGAAVARPALGSPGLDHGSATTPSVRSGTTPIPAQSREQSPTPSPSAAPTTEPPVSVRDLTVTVPATPFFGWALLDRRTGEIGGSANMATGTNTTESMIKVWIVGDYLRRLGTRQPSAADLAELSEVIVHSDDDGAETYYRRGGTNAVVQRMISICGLTGTTVYPYWWSRTTMTPLDAVRLGACVADGRAAGAWTPWLLEQMRAVQGGVAQQQATSGGGRWGIIDGLPATLAARTAIKNGWTPIGADGLWHVDNLAISDTWVLAVMVRYPIGAGLQYGADICSSVARQLSPALAA